MRAIIIDDKDANALLDQLQLSAFHQAGQRLPESLDPNSWKDWVVKEVHRKFHYVVCCWLQDQGARTTR